MSDYFYFFAYGASMNPITLVTRIRTCNAVGTGQLTGYRLSFDKRAGDSGGAYAEANVTETGQPTDVVTGVVYRVADRDSDTLDTCEGVGMGYKKVTGDIDLDSGTVEACFYVAEPGWIDDSLGPTDWYIALLSSGARIHGLPMVYQRMLRRIKTIRDPDRQRAEENFRLARKGDFLIPFPRKAEDR